jgi:hypothetical protein
LADYTTTDQDLLNVIEDRLLEVRNDGASVTSTQWVLADWITALNQAQRDFQKETAAVVTHLGFAGDSNNGIAVTPGTESIPMPQDCIEILRVAWIAYNTDDPVVVDAVTELPREDSWSLDLGASNWEIDPGHPPGEYNESISPVPNIYLAYPPDDIGKLDVIYAAVTTTLSNTGVHLDVPDEAAPYIAWRALQYILEKEGEGKDVVRAAYCKARFEEGVVLLKSLLATPYRLAAEGVL